MEAQKAKEEEERKKREEEERLKREEEERKEEEAKKLEEEKRLEEERKLEEEKRLEAEKKQSEEDEAKRLEEERLAAEKSQEKEEKGGLQEGENNSKEGDSLGTDVSVNDQKEGNIGAGQEQSGDKGVGKEGDQMEGIQEGKGGTSGEKGENEASLDNSFDKKDDGNSSRRIMTRSRNPNYKPPPPKSTPFVTYTNTIPKQTTTNTGRILRSAVKKEEPVLVINAKGEITRVEPKRDSDVIEETFYKLGMEGTYKLYENQFSVNRLALNKPQHAEDRDKKRHLANKFGLQSGVEFKWQGTIYGNKILTISTLRLTITQLESNIPTPFMHTNWPTHRNNWIKAVHMCSKPQAFALALSVLECAIKPVVFYPVWTDGLGHTKLKKMSIMEKEERKRAEKRKSDLEDDLHKISPWVKYCFPIKHQVSCKTHK